MSRFYGSLCMCDMYYVAYCISYCQFALNTSFDVTASLWKNWVDVNNKFTVFLVHLSTVRSQRYRTLHTIGDK